MANSNSLEAFLSNSDVNKPKQYTYEDLKDFTSDFSNKIGVGGFSNVYKGRFSSGTEVAVKVLTEKSIVKEVFMAEVNTMMKASHPNLVKLYGFCFSDSMKALVYEYMVHGSLDRVLYENHLDLEWKMVYGIMIETAKGISHLHDGCDEQIIHNDVKAANVLLDSNFSPKVTDFGLAKLMNRDKSHFTLTRTRGTPGYAAPEMWMPASVVTYKCDVYSFGMMLFEVLGMRYNQQNGQWFPKQVWENFENDCLDEIIDLCGIQGDDRERAKILSVVALWCCQFTPEIRPPMSTVVEVLEKEMHVTWPPDPFFPSTLVTSMEPSRVHIDKSEDPEFHFRYITEAVKSGQIEEVTRVTIESNFYDPEKTKNFLMEAKLSDARALINVCNRFGFISDLTHYLYTNNKLQDIEDYVQKVNPGNAPLVVGKLLDDECPESFIKGLLLSASSLLPVEPLVEECEKRNRLGLLTQFLEYLVSEGSKDVDVHNALGKIIVDSNNSSEHFLTSNPYYDSLVLGKYCESRPDPTLAFVAYRRGKYDDEVLYVTNIYSLFKLQAEYVVERMDSELWKRVLSPAYRYRPELIDQVVSSIMPSIESEEQVFSAVRAFMTADIPLDLLKLLESIVLQNAGFGGDFNLQNLLILTAIKSDRWKVMNYVNILDNFDGSAVGGATMGARLYEEAFVVFKKFNLNIQAVNVLLDRIGSIERAEEFATQVKENTIRNLVAKAQYESGKPYV